MFKSDMKKCSVFLDWTYDRCFGEWTYKKSQVGTVFGGDKYFGEFVAGFPSGKGIYQFNGESDKKGGIYLGAFSAMVANGYGTFYASKTKYSFSKKDVILVEALKSDGIKVSEKYKNLYEINESEIPSDIQIFIDSGDIAGAMLRIVEVIGQDEIKDIDEDTLYFIISTLNQLDADPLRNKILLKVLPLKI